MLTRPGSATYNPPGTAVALARAKWDEGITSTTDLAAVSTVNLTVPAIRAFVNSDTGSEEVWRLLTSTAATGDGVQRPTDFHATTNAKVWFRAG